MTWDEIRAAYPNQRMFVSAIEDHFDGELRHYRPVAVLEAAPPDEHAAFIRFLELEIVHGTVVNADTSQPELVDYPPLCVSVFCDCEDDDLEIPPMRVIVGHASHSSRVD